MEVVSFWLSAIGRSAMEGRPRVTRFPMVDLTEGGLLMGLPCVKPLAVYRPRDPQASDLWRLMNQHVETFAQVYEDRFQAKYGYWRPVIERSVRAFLRCGDLQEGFARVRCADCKYELFVAFSCKQRCTCSSCHQKRTLLTALHVAEEVCSPVAHRQVVLTIPKRLRLHTRFDRQLVGQLCCCAATCLQTEVRRLLGRDDVVPGMIGAMQTHGELLHWHPHLHMLVTCGAFTAKGEFLEVPEFDQDRLLAAWQQFVFDLYLAEDKVEPEVVETMRSWTHSGFSVDQSVLLPAGDRAGIERLVGYMIRCPFSLSRLIKVSQTGQVIYKAEKDSCRAFPDPRGVDLASGTKRNFQILSPLDFLAEFTQHIPPKGSHLIRYYGWYSNKARGLRKKAAAEAAAAAEATAASCGNQAAPVPARRRCSQTWAMLIKRVYEVDPLTCPRCGSEMAVVAFIEPPQREVIEKILLHCGLRPVSRAPPPSDGGRTSLADDSSLHGCDEFADRQSAPSDEPREVTYVDIDESLATL